LVELSGGTSHGQFETSCGIGDGGNIMGRFVGTGAGGPGRPKRLEGGGIGTTGTLAFRFKAARGDPAQLCGENFGAGRQESALNQHQANSIQACTAISQRIAGAGYCGASGAL